jgi:hypothetical protein
MAEQFNIEQANPEARRAERDRQRRMVFALPRTTGVESFLAYLGALHLDGQDHVQDALLILDDENINDGYGNVFPFDSNTLLHVQCLDLITELLFSIFIPLKKIF